jgi:hypothetical protein
VTAAGGRTPQEIASNCTFPLEGLEVIQLSAFMIFGVEYPPRMASAQERQLWDFGRIPHF